MVTKYKLLLGLLTLMILVGCNHVPSNDSEENIPKDISGLWFYIGSDSSYREVFYTDSSLWSYDEGGGPRFNRVKVTLNDTIEIYDNGELFNKYGIILIGKNEMILSTDLDTIKFIKVNNLLLSNDEMKWLLTGDLEKIQMFIDRFRTRASERRDVSK